VNPVTDFAAYDAFILAGVKSPGICTFPTAPERIEGWEQQIPSGSGGGYTIHKRSPPIEFDIELYLWVGEDENGVMVDGFAAYEAFKKIYRTTVKKTDPKALSFSHPLTDKLDPPVASVVIGKWGMPKPDGEGGGTARIHVVEYRPYIVKPVTGPQGTFAKKSDPNADLKNKLAVDLVTLDSVRNPGS
jgi:hypothetical protein